MNPMIVGFVQDRTEVLQRVAADIRRERELRSTVEALPVDQPAPTPFPIAVDVRSPAVRRIADRLDRPSRRLNHPRRHSRPVRSAPAPIGRRPALRWTAAGPCQIGRSTKTMVMTAAMADM